MKKVFVLGAFVFVGFSASPASAKELCGELKETGGNWSIGALTNNIESSSDPRKLELFKGKSVCANVIRDDGMIIEVGELTLEDMAHDPGDK